MRYGGETRPAIKRGSIIEFFGNDPTLVGSWSLDGNARDESRNGNNGTVTEAVVWPGRLRTSAYKFDGTNDKIVVADNANIRVANLTAGAWINWLSYGTGNPGILGKTGGVGNAGWAIYTVASSGLIRCRVSTDGTNGYPFNSVTTIKQGVWSFICFTYDGGTSRIFINGNLDAIDTTPSGSLYASTADLEIGKFTDGEYFNGIIQDCFMFSRDLSSSAISQYYQWAISEPRKYWFYSAEGIYKDSYFYRHLLSGRAA